PEMYTENSVRELPHDRKTPEEAEFGFEEPKIIPKGRISLSQATKLLKSHADNPKKYGANEAALEYNLDIKDSKNIIKYFIPLKVFDAEDKNSYSEFIAGSKTKEEQKELSSS
ncbi:hypothetical protein BIW11_10704, partial [Tropilaelaps mercedesae]